MEPYWPTAGNDWKKTLNQKWADAVYPRKWTDKKGTVWCRADNLTILERRNCQFRFRGKIMYTAPRKRPAPTKCTGFLYRLREIFRMG